MTKLEKAAQAVIQKSLDVRRDEVLLILADEPYLDLAHLLFAAAEKRTRYVHLLQITPEQLQKDPLCPPVAGLMQEMNAVVALTSVSISHTAARRQACQRGARVITLPAVTNDTFARIADMDFTRIGRLSRKLADILTIAKDIQVTAPNGTHLHINGTHRKGYADTGLVNTPGAFSNLPAGEACLAPVESATEGELVVDSGMGVQPGDAERITLSIKNGRAERILGGDPAQRLKRRLSVHGPEARLVAEFGIGSNDAARISGYALEDEKVVGTIHVALGNNVSFGGTNDVPIHLDAVVYKATVVVDGRSIMQNGKMVFE